MSVSASYSGIVEHNLPQDEGEFTLYLAAVAFAEQGWPTASKLDSGKVGVGRIEDPMPRAARRCGRVSDAFDRKAI